MKWPHTREDDEKLLRALSLRDHCGMSPAQIAWEMNDPKLTRTSWMKRMLRVDQASAKLDGERDAR